MPNIKIVKPDAVIFDVDGVLLDVSLSFVQVIRKAVLWGCKKFCGLSLEVGYTKSHERILKRHGAFNDDYDIAWTLICMAKAAKAFASLEFLASELKSFSGTPLSWITERYGDIVPRDEVRTECARLYFGDEHQAGLYELETPLLKEHWTDLPLPVGIYTGRNLPEWHLAAKKLGWEDFPLERVIHMDTGIAKPSPKGLEILCSMLGAENPIFFGDTASDLNAHRAFGKGYFAAIGNLLPEVEYKYSNPKDALQELGILNFHAPCVYLSAHIY